LSYRAHRSADAADRSRAAGMCRTEQLSMHSTVNLLAMISAGDHVLATRAADLIEGTRDHLSNSARRRCLPLLRSRIRSVARKRVRVRQRAAERAESTEGIRATAGARRRQTCAEPDLRSRHRQCRGASGGSRAVNATSVSAGIGRVEPHDQHGDVVAAAGVVRLRHQLRARRLRIQLRTEDGRDRSVGHHLGQSIGAQQ
jgi:hypothetical protein